MNFAIGDHYEKTFIVSDQTYEGFIDLFNDRNPLHINESFARERGFKDKVMHGNILNGFLSFFIGECLPVKNVIIQTQEIQFKNPVYIDDELLFKADVTGIFDSVNAIEFKFSFRNSDLKVVASGKIQIGILK